MYQILIERTAEKDLNSINEPLFSSLVNHIKALSQNSRPEGCRKLKGLENYWRIRVGNYRIIYEIDDLIQTLKIMRVRHRKEVYKGF